MTRKLDIRSILTMLLATGMLAGCQDVWQTRVKLDYGQVYLDARTALMQAADDPDPVTRTNAVEALSQTLGEEAGAVYTQALKDPYPSVRFAAAMAVGDLRYEPAKTTLQAMALPGGQSDMAEPDKRVFCAVIYALHQLGDTTYTSELSDLLRDAEKEVRANAAMVMGKMGEPSAVVPLQMQLADEQDPTVQLELVEALALLGDQKNIDRLEAYTKTQILEDQLVAISAMGHVRSARTFPVLQAMTADRYPPRIRVAALGALAKLGQVDSAGYRLALKSVRKPEEVMRKAYKGKRQVSQLEVLSLQRLAAISLGWMKMLDAAAALHPLLHSPDGGVRVASAMSLVRLLGAYRPLELPAQQAEEQQAGETPEPVTKTELYTAGGKD